MQTVSSEELYKQVWQRPLMKVAADYSITGTALKKICDRHEIPTPREAIGPSWHTASPSATHHCRSQVRTV